MWIVVRLAVKYNFITNCTDKKLNDKNRRPKYNIKIFCNWDTKESIRNLAKESIIKNKKWYHDITSLIKKWWSLALIKSLINHNEVSKYWNRKFNWCLVCEENESKSTTDFWIL